MRIFSLNTFPSNESEMTEFKYHHHSTPNELTEVETLSIAAAFTERQCLSFLMEEEREPDETSTSYN